MDLRRRARRVRCSNDAADIVIAEHVAGADDHRAGSRILHHSRRRFTTLHGTSRLLAGPAVDGFDKNQSREVPIGRDAVQAVGGTRTLHLAGPLNLL